MGLFDRHIVKKGSIFPDTFVKGNQGPEARRGPNVLNRNKRQKSRCRGTIKKKQVFQASMSATFTVAAGRVRRKRKGKVRQPSQISPLKLPERIPNKKEEE